MSNWNPLVGTLRKISLEHLPCELDLHSGETIDYCWIGDVTVHISTESVSATILVAPRSGDDRIMHTSEIREVRIKDV